MRTVLLVTSAASTNAPRAASCAAFFDVDNTMMVGASMFHFARGLAQRGFFSGADLMSFAVRQARFRMGGESPSRMMHARESALAFVAGKRVEDLVAQCEQIFDADLADRIWPGTLALARAHLDAGDAVWLVTATPIELARIIADRLGLSGALGTVAQTSHGAYTGHLVGNVLHAQAKADAVAALALAHGWDLAHCAAYSDSINDLPMLSLVGRPVAVNPDSALRMEARSRSWEIHDFRSARKVGLACVRAAAGAAVAAVVVLSVMWRVRRSTRCRGARAA
jgi:HAD superfamily hydrolase (TIGR01490 family)